MSKWAGAFEIKAVSTSDRIIEGYAAVFGNIDRGGDVIEQGAFARTLVENTDVLALIAHETSSLPVGDPLKINEDAKGLYTRTRVYKTAAGDDLLEVASQRMTASKSLGMSIGYVTKDAVYETVGGMSVRKIKDVDLYEYSFLGSPTMAMNPLAMTTGVKCAACVAAEAASKNDPNGEHVHDDKAGARLGRAQRDALRQITEGLSALQRWAEYVDEHGKTDDDKDDESDDDPKGTPNADLIREFMELELALATV